MNMGHMLHSMGHGRQTLVPDLACIRCELFVQLLSGTQPGIDDPVFGRALPAREPEQVLPSTLSKRTAA